MEPERKHSVGDTTLHTRRPCRRTIPYRVYAVIHSCGIVALMYHHLHSLLTQNTTLVTSLLLLSDVVLAFMWATTASLHINPVRRTEYPENYPAKPEDFPKLDVFICTADPYKEPPIMVVNTALSVMAYDYPSDKISVYVSDDGGSSLTLFALMEAANFSKLWIPFCKKNNVQDRSPQVYFSSKSQSHSCKEAQNLKMIYEDMKSRVEHVVEAGNVNADFIACDKLRAVFDLWTHKFTRHDHPTIIQVLLNSETDMDDNKKYKMPNLIYVSREKSKVSSHHYKAGALNTLLRVSGVMTNSPIILTLVVLALAHNVAGCVYEYNTNWGSKIGYRYGSLVEDYYTGYKLHCEGWKSVFCSPKRAAFLGEAPKSLIDIVSQQKRWGTGLLEVAFLRDSPIIYGVRKMGILLGLGYCHYAFWPIWSIPLIIYGFLSQLALLHGVSVFPKSSDPWFWLYIALIVGAYGQNILDFKLEGGTYREWWNDQRMWLIRGMTSFFFGFIECILKTVNLSTFGFNITSKANDDEEQSKRYEQEIFDFGPSSSMFLPITTAAIVNLLAFVWGLYGLFAWGAELNLELMLASFAVVNCMPIYEAMTLRKDNGKLPKRICFLTGIITLVLIVSSYFLLK